MMLKPALRPPLRAPMRGATTLREGGGVFVPTDADAIALFARMSTQPSNAEQRIIHALIVGLKSDGLWAKLHVLYDLGAHDDQAQTLNWLSTSYTLTPSGAPTHLLDLYSYGDGSATYWDTGYKFSAGQQNDAHLGIYSPFSSQKANADFGNSNAAIVIRNTSDQAFYRTNAGSASSAITNTDGRGHYVASRTGSAAGNDILYKDGVSIGSSTATSTTPDATYNFNIGRRAQASPTFSDRRLAIVHAGTGLSAQDAANFTARLATYLAAKTAMLRARSLARSAKTNNLLNYVKSMTTSAAYLLGQHDRFDSAGTAPDWEGRRADFFTATGKYPAYMQIEYVDRQQPSGATRYGNMLTRMTQVYDAGGLLMLHDHPGNPVTGVLESVIFAGSGGYDDRTGTPLDAVQAGGTARNAFLAYCDRLADTLKRLTSGGNRIPVMLRWWHECNQAFFWWAPDNSSGERVKFVQMYKDSIDRLRAAGVDNMLIVFNVSSLANNRTPERYAEFYPGSDYVDMVSLDYYDDGSDEAAVVGLSSAFVSDMTSAIETVATTAKPLLFSEVGYQYAADSKAGIWDTMTGGVITSTYPRVAALGLWRPPWGPASTDSNTASLVAMVADTNCITQDRLVSPYG